MPTALLCRGILGVAKEGGEFMKERILDVVSS
jgi:hypothetical protein